MQPISIAVPLLWGVSVLHVWELNLNRARTLKFQLFKKKKSWIPFCVIHPNSTNPHVHVRLIPKDRHFFCIVHVYCRILVEQNVSPSPKSSFCFLLSEFSTHSCPLTLSPRLVAMTILSCLLRILRFYSVVNDNAADFSSVVIPLDNNTTLTQLYLRLQ